MKAIRIVICVLFAFYFTSCKSTVNSLPELEAAKADSLVQLKGHELWVTAASYSDNKKLPPATDIILPETVACASITHFRVQIFYPITVCRRPDYFIDVSKMSVLFGGNESLMKKVNSTSKDSAFKMNGTKRISITSPLWCRQVSGPWVAEVFEEQNCGNPNSYRTTVTLTGIAEMVSWQWNGRFEERKAAFGIETFGEHFGVTQTRRDCDATDTNNCVSL